MDKRYEKIIDLPHHTSATHRPMSLYNRAAQFSPFAALTGYEDVISDSQQEYETKQELLNTHGDTEEF